MDNLFLFNSSFRWAVSGAVFWEMKKATPFKILGASDSTGRYQGEILDGKSFRIFADGFRANDYQPDGYDQVKKTMRIGLVKLHVGFYSGYFSQKKQTVWKQDSSNKFLIFRSNGFCETWTTDGNGNDIGARERFRYTAAEQEDVWTRCTVKSWDFPILPQTPVELIEPFDAFRFPESGKMIGRTKNSGPEIGFTLVN